MLGISLPQLLGQPRASEFLQGLVARGRYANAYLFHGTNGVGKLTAAFSFARAILCHSTPDATPAGGAPREAGLGGGGLFDALPEAAPPAPAKPAGDACGVCSACRKFEGLAHPDLKLLFPVFGEEKEVPELLALTYANLREDPLFVFRYDKFASIRINHTRDLLKDLAYRPFEATRRVVVVRDADRMREDQASALLKSIEEPGDSTIWILTTSRLSRLPVTIRSRCQRVRFAPLTEALIIEQLVKRTGMESQAARFTAALASGSLGRAYELREDDPAKLRDKALALLQPAEAGDPALLFQTAQKFMNFGRTGREELRRMVEFHQLRLRDVLRTRVAGDDAELVHVDLAADTKRLAMRIDATEVRRRLMVLEELLRSIEGNVSPDAAMFSAMARVAGMRLGEGEWPRHSAARWDY